MTIPRRLGSVAARLIAATGLLVAAHTVVPVSAAADPASSCEGRDGVIVVVDFAELGGGVTKGCSADGGTAAELFKRADFGLTRVTSSPSFVCRVSGKPSDAACADTPPVNAYWSLWTADGTAESWSYAQSGVDGQRVAEGGYVAFAWHQGGGRAAAPAVTPSARVAEAEPTPSTGGGTGGSGTGGGKGGGSNGSGGPGPSAGESASPADPSSATPTGEPGETGSPSARASASERPTATDDAADESASTELPGIDEIPEGAPAAEPDDDEGGFPAWVGIGLAVLVLGAAGAVPIIRRRAG
ncbi:hypothetical protein ACFQ0K_12070 [Nocardioides caeni]|uniref:Uncharacterized protein n=1 Tax=Nocardioides caeni TaxID=574700 RepID=A0A4S8NQR6_9ACTN|nr:hypothetical protein [Nocardioides caeni]THV17824.1 hypothetical protein E9934_05000 [Nocardioides caeni]